MGILDSHGLFPKEASGVWRQHSCACMATFLVVVSGHVGERKYGQPKVRPWCRRVGAMAPRQKSRRAGEDAAVGG